MAEANAVGRVEFEERLKKILVDQLQYPLNTERIHAQTSLYGKGLGLDSLDVVALVVRLEDEFDIFFEPDEVAASVKTFGSLVATIGRKLDAHAPEGDR